MDPGAAGGAGARERAAPARARLTGRGAAPDPIRLGVSFSVRRARSRGLDWRSAFARILELGLDPLRLSATWREIDADGWSELDWLLDAAAAAGRRVLLTTGMKGQGWPEFFIPDRLVPPARLGADVAAHSEPLRAGTLAFVRATVERYRSRPEIIAWQVENEPLNRSGPSRWWIGPGFVAEEVDLVRRLDEGGGRPVVVNAFARFNLVHDAVSSPHGLHPTWLLGLRRRRPEAEALALLAPGDVLGLDVYRCIGSLRLGPFPLHTSNIWRLNADRWLRQARATGCESWIVEAQAEPWPSSRPALAWGAAPACCSAAEVVETVDGLAAAGHTTILLWGAEHWLAADTAGDPSWLDAVRSLIDRRAA